MTSTITRSVRLLSFLLLSAVAAAGPVQAQSAAAFGVGLPAGPDDLPPGRLRSKVQTLPPAAQRRAVEWLQRFEFPTADVANLHADDEGGILYADDPAPPQAGEGDATSSGPTVAAALGELETFSLHSRPGAASIVFLDFDGALITGTAWNNAAGVDPLQARAYDTDGAPATFSQDELDRIAEIWHRVAEDFVSFDVDVTTEEPAVLDAHTAHVLITEDRDETGVTMPYAGAGGVAYVGVFGSSSYGYYSPALVYFDNLGSGFPPYVAEAASHEMGHNNGLSHDGTTAGASYYSGHGSGLVSWAPIMGSSYQRNVTQWSQGEYAGANNLQDDLDILATDFGFRLDDHGDTPASASPLLVDGAGAVDATNPEIDPENVYFENKGTIDHRDDTDAFWIDTAAGAVDLVVTPAWDAFTRSSRRGANLDLRATLLDSGGAVVASAEPTDDTSARITATVSAGRYYLTVTGVGNTASPYSDYASIGQFFVAGVVPPVVEDFDPPMPSTMDWMSAPTVTSPSSIAMTAVAATDASGVVEYYFECTAAAAVCADSGWQSSASYAATGLDAHTIYTFRVRARDAFGNTNDWSSAANATTPNTAPIARDDAGTTPLNQSVAVAILSNDEDPDGDPIAVTTIGTASNGSVAQSGESITYTPAPGFVGTDSFDYTLSDGIDDAIATVTITVESPQQPPAAPVATASVDGAGIVTVTWSYEGADVTGFDIARESWHNKRGTWVKQTVVAAVEPSERSFTDAPGSGTFRYQVRASNAAGSAASEWTTPVSSSGGEGGGDPKCHPKRGC